MCPGCGHHTTAGDLKPSDIEFFPPQTQVLCFELGVPQNSVGIRTSGRHWHLMHAKLTFALHAANRLHYAILVAPSSVELVSVEQVLLPTRKVVQSSACAECGYCDVPEMFWNLCCASQFVVVSLAVGLIS